MDPIGIVASGTPVPISNRPLAGGETVLGRLPFMEGPFLDAFAVGGRHAQRAISPGVGKGTTRSRLRAVTRLGHTSLLHREPHRNRGNSRNYVNGLRSMLSCLTSLSDRD